VSLGFYVLEILERSVRQGVTYSKSSDASESLWGGPTRGSIDAVFGLKAVRQYVGPSIGYPFGESSNDRWAGGLEGGIKICVKPHTFIFGSIEYLWFLDSGNAATDKFDDKRFAYTVSIGFNF
jgi:hypothetical protein